MLYGKGGVLEALRWEPKLHGIYYKEYLKNGGTNVLNMPKIGE